MKRQSSMNFQASAKYYRRITTNWNKLSLSGKKLIQFSICLLIRPLIRALISRNDIDCWRLKIEKIKIFRLKIKNRVRSSTWCEWWASCRKCKCCVWFQTYARELAREVIFDLICGSECDHSAHELARELARDTAPKKIRPSNEMCVICVLLHNILLHKIFIEHVE